MKCFREYEVTLRRDVQQIVVVRVESTSPSDAIATAEAVVDDDAWQLEEYIGTHRPKAKLVPKRQRKAS